MTCYALSCENYVWVQDLVMDLDALIEERVFGPLMQGLGGVSQVISTFACFTAIFLPIIQGCLLFILLVLLKAPMLRWHLPAPALWLFFGLFLPIFR